MLSFSLLSPGLGANPTIAPLVHQAAFLMPPPPPVNGECTSDGQLIWRAATATVPGHWERLNAGEQCVTIGTKSVDPSVGGQGGIGAELCYARGTHTIVECPPPDPNAPHGPMPAPEHKPMKMIQVGPFTIPYQARQFTIHWSTLLPTEWRNFINQELAHDCDNCVISSMKDATDMPQLRDFLGAGMPARFNQDFVVGSKMNVDMFHPGKVTVTANTDLSSYNPIVLTQHPDTGEDFGIYMMLGVQDPTSPWDAKTNPAVLNLLWRKVERSWYEAAWNWIKHIVAKIVEIGGELICGYVCTPAAVDAAMKAAVASKNPYAIGGALIGSAIAIGNCSCPLPPLAPVVPPTDYTWWIIGGLLTALGIGVVAWRS
jgi:hypothetical protein